VVVGAYHLSPIGQVVDAVRNDDARYLIPGYYAYNQYEQTRDAYVQAGFAAEDAKTLAIFRSVPVLSWAVFAEEVRTGRSLSPQTFDRPLTAEDYGRGVSQIALDLTLLRGVGRFLGGGGGGAGAGPRGAGPPGWVGQAWSWTKTAGSWAQTALTPTPVWALRGIGWAAGRALRGVAPQWTAQFEVQVHAQHANGWGGAVQYQLAQWLRLNICFGAGTPLRTPTGAKLIEEIQEGDLLLARDESDPTAPVEAKRVEAVFVRTGHLLHVHVAGQVIRTTAEHPFWVEGKGWTPARELRAGDRLSSHDGHWVAIEEVFDTGEYEVVYNLQVADFHTYFAGSLEWGFSVWAHNAEYNGTRVNNVIESEIGRRLSKNTQADAVGRAVQNGNEALVKQLLEGYGVAEGDLDRVTSQLFTDGGVTPQAAPARFARSGLTPADLQPPPGAPVGETYLVNGQRPIVIDLTNPNWKQTIPPGTPTEGIYIVRTQQGQILKPGDLSRINRLGDYRSWVTQDGIPIVVEYYPLQRPFPGSLQRVAQDLRAKLQADGWNLPRDRERIGPNRRLFIDVAREGE
jgi:hypothetical protein